MAQKKGSRKWWWIVPMVVILGGLGYYWVTSGKPEIEQTLVATEISPDQATEAPKGGRETAPSDEEAAAAGKKAGPEPETDVEKPVVERVVENETTVETFSITKETDTPGSRKAAQGPIEELYIAAAEESVPTPVKTEASADEKMASKQEPAQSEAEESAYCVIIEEEVSDFFEFLEAKPYFQRFQLNKDAYAYFSHIMKRLTAQPPIPAGEGMQPAILLKNIFYFSRALDRKDLRVIKAVLANEGDTMEFNLETFYRWLMLGKECPDPGNLRPPFEATYQYAGFFLNTTGGRAYLFRRTMRLRLLISYYCVLIVYQADRLGKNTYGLNVLPYVETLKKELAHHPELEFQEQYIRTLNRVENYYRKRR